MAENDNNNFSGFITREINNNWFIALESGVGTYSGEYYNKGDIANRLGFIFGFSVGKFVTPTYGFRIQFNSGQISGNKFPDIEGYKSNLEIFSVHADMLINISTAIRGYKSSKGLDLMFYWGGGVISSTTTEICINTGLMNKYKCTERFSIDLNIGCTALNSTIAKCELANKVRFLPSIQIGFTYYYKAFGFNRD